MGQGILSKRQLGTRVKGESAPRTVACCETPTVSFAFAICYLLLPSVMARASQANASFCISLSNLCGPS